MDVLVLIGRIVFAVLFIGSGVGHFQNANAMTGFVKSKGVPMARAAVLGSGVLLVVGALSVALGVWADLGALLLIVFLLPAAFLMHNFWTQTDPMAKQNDQAHFMKDLALAGAALALFAFFASTGDILGLTLTDPLFSL